MTNDKLLELKFEEKENIMKILENSTNKREIDTCRLRLDQIEIELLLRRIEIIKETNNKELLKTLYEFLKQLLDISMRKMEFDCCNRKQDLEEQFNKQKIYSQLDEVDRVYFRK